MIHSIDRSFDLSISQSVSQLYLLSPKCIYLHVTTNTSFYQDSSRTREPMDSFCDVCTTASAVSTRPSFATVTERTRRNFCTTFSFPNLIISNLEGGQFTFRPLYSQQKQVMLPINLLKTEKQVTVLLCSAVPRFLKERARFESLHASPDVLVTAAWRWFLWRIRGMMSTGGNRSFRTETDS